MCVGSSDDIIQPNYNKKHSKKLKNNIKSVLYTIEIYLSPTVISLDKKNNNIGHL